ncbi:mechanosensitive ion channel domain-containing protein [Pseudomonas akapageensis]|uniref:mechanosensitive ion channel domain-containing protein n=1 Tax=Pseudomonas akapageensis TaxID=2609961 RepID=UPI0014096F7B|nr:mechanosensitive ion channel family protein [Pseudomonas akapageensis]
MPPFVQNHPLVISVVLLLLDVLAWRMIPASRQIWSASTRLLLFVLYSAVIFQAGMGPTNPPPFTDDTQNLVATILEIIWWLFGARTLTVVISLLMPRIGHAGRLFQDVLGALIFLVAIVAAATYVLDLPVKGLLATSGIMAIVIGLALQSTLSDVFSGIVLNITKPYLLDDWVSIEDTEGKVIEIDWRATHLLTSQGSTVVIPNSLAAKTKVHNFSRPIDINGVTIHLSVPVQVRPRLVLDALEKAMQGIGALLPNPKPKVTIKGSDLESMQYEAIGFVRAGENKAEIRNLMYDLAHRHLEASGIDFTSEPVTRHQSSRLLLEEMKVFRDLSTAEKESLSQHMSPLAYSAGQVVLDYGEIAGGLLVIGTGVVRATVLEQGDTLEAGRLGPGDIFGEEGVAAEAPSLARFTALTPCKIYRIDKDIIKGYLEQHVEVLAAISNLRHQRSQLSDSLLTPKPSPIKKTGFLQWWLKRRP